MNKTRMYTTTYTTRRRRSAARRGWHKRGNLYWVDRGVKPVDKVPVGTVVALINR